MKIERDTKIMRDLREMINETLLTFAFENVIDSKHSCISRVSPNAKLIFPLYHSRKLFSCMFAWLQGINVKLIKNSAKIKRNLIEKESPETNGNIVFCSVASFGCACCTHTHTQQTHTITPQALELSLSLCLSQAVLLIKNFVYT